MHANCPIAPPTPDELVIRGYQGAETRVRDVVHPWRTKHSPSVRRRRSTAALHWLVLTSRSKSSRKLGSCSTVRFRPPPGWRMRPFAAPSPLNQLSDAGNELDKNC